MLLWTIMSDPVSDAELMKKLSDQAKEGNCVPIDPDADEKIQEKCKKMLTAYGFEGNFKVI